MPRWRNTYEAAKAQRRLWTPNILHPVCWFDAADRATITIATGVSSWANKGSAGGSLAQGTASNQPTYNVSGFNGLPTLDFDNTNDQLGGTITSLPSTGDLFFAAVFQMRAGTGIWRPVVGFRSSANTTLNGAPILQRMSNTSQIGVHNTGVVDTRIKVDVTDLTARRIATYGRSGGTNGNGGAVTVTATGNSQASYRTDGTQTWGNSSGTYLQIGGVQTATLGWLDGLVSEVIALNYKPSDTTREKIEGYMAWKWGLADMLVATSPFKNRPPLIGD